MRDRELTSFDKSIGIFMLSLVLSAPLVGWSAAALGEPHAYARFNILAGIAFALACAIPGSPLRTAVVVATCPIRHAAAIVFRLLCGLAPRLRRGISITLLVAFCVLMGHAIMAYATPEARMIAGLAQVSPPPGATLAYAREPAGAGAAMLDATVAFPSGNAPAWAGPAPRQGAGFELHLRYPMPPSVLPGIPERVRADLARATLDGCHAFQPARCRSGWVIAAGGQRLHAGLAHPESALQTDPSVALLLPGLLLILLAPVMLTTPAAEVEAGCWVLWLLPTLLVFMVAAGPAAWFYLG